MAKPWEQDWSAGEGEAASSVKKPWEQNFLAEPEPTAGVAAKDIGLAIKKGVERIPGSLTGMADAVLGATVGADRPAGRLADLLGEVTGFQPSKMAQADEAKHSPGYKAQKDQLNQAWDSSGANTLSRLLFSPSDWDQVPEAWRNLDGKALAGTIARNPGASVATAVESVPGMLVGGAIGRGAGMAAKALAPKAAGGILGTLAGEGTLSAATRAGIGEGAITAGQMMDSIDPSVDPRSAGAAALAGGALTGLIGGSSGVLASKLGLPDIEMALAGGAKGSNPLSLAKRLPASLVQEGLLEELPQSMQEQVWQNLAEGNPLGEGALRQGVEGALAGMVTAGAFNALPRKNAGQAPADPNAPQPPNPQLDAFIDVANQAAGAEMSNYQGLPSGQRLLESLAIPMPAPGSLADAAQTARGMGATSADPTAQLLKAYPTREAAQAEMESRPDAAMRSIVPHPRGNSGFAVVRKSDSETAQIQLQQQRESETKATQQSATQQAEARQAQLDSEENAARQDGQALKTIVDLNRSAAALEKSITSHTAPADAENIRAQAAEIRAEARAVQESAKVAKASRAAEAGKAMAQAPASAEETAAAAQLGETAQDELAPAPAQPVGELPGAQSANQAKAAAANTASLARQEQLAAEEGVAPPSPAAQPAPAQPVVQAPAGAADIAATAQSEEAAQDELTTAGAQPVLSMPGVQAANRAKVEAANASNQTRQVQLASEEAATIDEAAAGTNTAPTDEQKASGNYEKGRFAVGGVSVAVENPVGSTRSGVEKGKAWKTKMSAHYGEIDGTIGADGGPVDAYVKAGTAATHDGPVFVVDQYDPNSGRFDEHKVLIGYGNAAEAAKAYDAHFSDKSGPKRRGAVTQMTMRGLKTWLTKADTTAPVSPTRFNGQAATEEQAAQDGIRASGGRFSRARGATPAPAETADERLARKAAESNTRKSGRQEKARIPTQNGDVAAINQAAGVSDAEVVREMPSATRAKVDQISKQQANFISNVAKLFGKRAVFFQSASLKHDGMWNQGNVIYLNSTSSVLQLRVLGHELTHAMKVQAPEAYQQMLAAVSDLLTDTQLAAQHQDYFGTALADTAALDQPAKGTGDLTLREFLTEEWMADLSGNRFAEESFWQDVFSAVSDRHGSAAAKGIVGRLRMAIANALNKLLQAVRGGKFSVDERLADRLEQVRAAVKDGFVAYERAVKDGQLRQNSEQSSPSVVKFAGRSTKRRSVRDVTEDLNTALAQLKAAPPASRPGINRRIGQLQQERTALADGEYSRTRRAVDYGEMRASARRGVNIEVAPDPRDEAAKGAFDALPEDGKKEVTYKVAERVLPQLLRDMGVEGRIEYTIGGFAGGTAPSIIVHFDEATPYSAVKEFAVVSGALLRQQAAISYDEGSTGGNQTTFVYATPDRALSYDEQKTLFQEIYDRYPSAEGFTGRDGMLVFGNFGDTSDEEFHRGIDKALADIQHAATFQTARKRFESDWHEPLNLEGTRYGQGDTSTARRAAAVRGQGFFDTLQAEADRFTRDAIAAAGRDAGRDAGYSSARPGGSRAGDEGGADRAGSGNAEIVSGSRRQGSSSAPEYGQPRDGAISLAGFHYSKAQQQSLAGRLYGTGMAGAEARRLDRWSATPEQKHRVHYYVDEGAGIAPESGVGTHLHATQLRNIYDWQADPLKLVEQARQQRKAGEDASDAFNYFEQLVAAQGFDGYYRPKAQGTQGVVVLLGSKHSAVPVAYLGQRGRIKNGEPLEVVDTPAPAPRPAVPTPAASASTGDGPDRVGPFSSEKWAMVSAAHWQKKGSTYELEQQGEEFWLRKVGGAAPKFSAARGQQRQGDLFPKTFATKRTSIMQTVVVSSKGDTEQIRKGNIDSAGRQIAATVQGLENFWLWYGDGPVDSKGRPVLMYHSTNGSFNAFEIGREAVNNYGLLGDVTTTRSGIFATPVVEFSQEYLRDGAGQNVMPVFLALQNPVDLRDGISGATISEIVSQTDLRHADFYHMTPSGMWQLFDDEFGAKVVEALQAAGYDGAILMEDSPGGQSAGGETYVAFAPNSVKSATGNRGTFDGGNSDIRWSRRRTQSLSDTQQALTESPQFIEWFGNSKMRAHDGTPLLFMHGTPSSFDAFSNAALGASSSHSSAGLGHFFTLDPQTAERYAQGGTVLDGWLRVERPYLMPLTEAQAFEDARAAADRRAVLQQQGYDGAVILDDRGKPWSVVAFEPWQFKAADNNGSFDEFDDRFRYSRRRTIQDLSPAQEAAADRVLGARRTWADSWKSFKQDWAKNLKQGIFDQFMPLRELDPHAYMLARLSKGGDSTLEALMLYGKLRLDASGATDVRYTQGGGLQGFAGKMAKLKGEHERFLVWVAAQRADRLMQIGLENLWTPQDIAALSTLDQGALADGTPRAPAYAQALQDLNEFNDNVLEIAEGSGLIDPATRQMYAGQPYVPFYRLQDEGVSGFGVKAGLVNQHAWKKLKGGTQKLNEDLLANLLHNWSHLITASAKNRAAKATLDAAVAAGIAGQVPTGTPGKGFVSYKDAGQEKKFAVSDPHILDAVAALEYAGLGPWSKPLTTAKHWLTIGVTANPAFKLRNLMRDSISAIGQASLSYNPARNIGQGWGATAKESEVRAHMLAAGGMIRFGSMLDGQHSQRAQDLINSGVDPSMILDDESKIKAFWKRYVHPALEAYNELGDRTEQVNRAALYEQLRAKGLDHLEASYWARDMMDFSMHGKWTAIRGLTQVVPFMNARLQGLYKLGRSGKDDIRRLGTVLGAVSLFSLGLLFAAKGDDDDWKDWQARSETDRNNYWWFKVGGHAFRIPKPFEIGAVGTIAERGFEIMSDDEMTPKRFGKVMSQIVLSQLAMNPTPQLFKPMMDVYANTDAFTGASIESPGMEKLRKEDRFDERTSEVAKFLGGLGLPDPTQLAMGRWDSLSPKQVDYLARGYFSWLATATTVALDFGIRPMLDRGERPAMKLKDAFFVGNFVESLPANGSRYVQRMYDQAKEIEEAYGSWHSRLKMGDAAGAQEIFTSEGDKILMHGRIEQIKKAESLVNVQIRRVEADKALSADEKRSRLDMLYQRKNQIAQGYVGF